MAYARALKDVFIVGAKRTALGDMGGALKNHTGTQLLTAAAKAAVAEANIPADAIDSSVTGCVMRSDLDALYIPTHVARNVGCRDDVDGVMVTRNCGSGLQALITAAQQISVGECDVVLAGGVETMSRLPHVVRNIRFGIPVMSLDIELRDTLWECLNDYGPDYKRGYPMGITAENLAEQYNISRQDCDEFALSSIQKWAKAKDSGVFDNEIVPVEVKTKKGMTQFDTDEHPRRDTTLDKLAKLAPAFKKDGVVTAGGASGIGDGAAALVLASAEAVRTHNLQPLARIAAYGLAGCDPLVMGIGPVPAIRKMLEKAELSIGNMDHFEINEAFASQSISVMKELGVENGNPHGGAIAMGHPVGMSGARIGTHITQSLQRTGQKYGLGSACIGGGQGIAMIFENAN